MTTHAEMVARLQAINPFGTLVYPEETYYRFSVEKHLLDPRKYTVLMADGSDNEGLYFDVTAFGLHDLRATIDNYIKYHNVPADDPEDDEDDEEGEQ
jgi:hypothetical protein